jgi:hypothetical protein
LTEICSAGTRTPLASNAWNDFTYRPMFMTWYVPGAVAANW